MSQHLPIPLVVWFDDDCGVCSAAVRFLTDRVDGSVRFRPSRELTDPRLRARAGEALLVVGPRGLEEGRAAVAAILGRGGPLERAAGVVLGLPLVAGIADRVYAWVAANRSRLSARLGLAAGCALPAPPPESTA